MAIILKPRVAAVMQGDHSFGSAEVTISLDSKLKLQITGPDAEMLFFDGPPAGKKWTVVLNAFVKETDA